MQRTAQVIIAGLLFVSVTGLAYRRTSSPADAGAYATSTVSVSITNPATGSVLNTDIYYPSNASGVDPQGVPHPALVFARGLLTIPAFYANSGRLLASSGYILAIPHFPSENIETRASDARYVLSFLESENANTASLFFQEIDPQRLGIIGHSLGGLTALMVAARDSRIRVAIALDAVNPPPFMRLGSWDYASEAPGITAPVAILGAPAQTCNYDAKYSSLYPSIGSEHKALVVFANGNHCDFQSRRECYLVCSGGGAYDAERVREIDRELVAWLGYYFRLATRK